MTVPDIGPTRKQRFNAALALAGLTQTEWRTSVFQVSVQHLNEVLNGDREGGPELNAAISALIDEHLAPVEVRNVTVARGTDDGQAA
jgi:hypothetical protein